MSLVELIVDRGADAVDALRKGIRKSEKAVAETIENNVRNLIIDEQPSNHSSAFSPCVGPTRSPSSGSSIVSRSCRGI